VENPARPAAEVLTEALGEPRRRMAALGPDPLDAVEWDCGCRARTANSELRAWESCPQHLPFRDAVMTRLAIASARRR